MYNSNRNSNNIMLLLNMCIVPIAYKSNFIYNIISQFIHNKFHMFIYKITNGRVVQTEREIQFWTVMRKIQFQYYTSSTNNNWHNKLPNEISKTISRIRNAEVCISWYWKIMKNVDDKYKPKSLRVKNTTVLRKPFSYIIQMKSIAHEWVK